jgi:hypothetical protein
MENTSSGVDVGWDGSNQRISRQFDWNETPPSVAIVRLLSVAMNCDPIDIDPLGETVDPDALDRLLPSMDAGSKLQFSHCHLSVSLCGDGTATVESEGR